MKKVIIDTNFLLLPGQKMIDIFSGLESVMDEPFITVVLDKTLNELEKIGSGNSKDSRAARLGLALVMARKSESPTFWERIIGLKERKSLKIVRSFGKGYVDDAILRFADGDTFVATLDRALKSRLKSKGVGVIGLRGNRLIIER